LYLFLQVHLVEVDVDRPEAAGMRLNVAHEHLLVPTVDRQVDEMGASGLDEDLLKLEPVERDRRRLGVVPVDDGGQLALAQQAARALAELLSWCAVQLHRSAAGWRGPPILRQPRERRHETVGVGKLLTSERRPRPSASDSSSRMTARASAMPPVMMPASAL